MKIYIVGGNAFARECHLYISQIQAYDPAIQFCGFLGHGGFGHTVDYKELQNFYLGEVSEHVFEDDEFVVIGAANPEIRKKIYYELKERNIKFYTLIKYSVEIPKSVSIGEANIILYSSISINTTIGNGNILNGDVTIGHDCEIGNFNFFGPRCQILGEAKIGDENQFGVNSILLPKAKIGNNNIIAPLSAVYKGCKNNCYMIGNPALKEGTV